MAAEHVLHMQKALDQMNLQIHRALNDITGVSGLKILDAILAGERDPLTLARLCHGGVKNSEDTIAKSLEGDYRPEHLFALRQSLAAYRYYQNLVLEADASAASPNTLCASGSHSNATFLGTGSLRCLSIRDE